MLFNIRTLLCVIGVPSESAANEWDADPILLAHRGLVRHAPDNLEAEGLAVEAAGKLSLTWAQIKTAASR